MPQNIPPIFEPDYEDPKEIHAFYGLAAYYAQCVEQSIIILLTTLRASTEANELKGVSYDDVLTMLDKKPMGWLIKLLQKVAPVEPGLQTRLESLLHTRNYLVHRFFVQNSEKLFTKTGRKSAIDELWQIARAFQECDHILVRIYEDIFAKFGYSSEYIDGEVEKMRASCS